MARFARPLGVTLLVSACTGTPDDEAALADRYALPDEAGHPESVAFAEDERAFYMGGLVDGRVTRLAADGATSTVYQPDAGWMSLGVKIAPSGELVVCAVLGADGDAPRSELWVFDRASDEPPARIDLGAGSTCNDLALDGDDAWVTDRERGVLYHASLSGGTAEAWLTDARLDPELIGMNGVVVVGDALVVGKYMPPRLFRVPLADPSALTEVDVPEGVFGSFPDGPDGFALDGADLLVAANTTVVRLASDDGWATATGAPASAPVGVAALTLAEGRVYGLKGEIVPFVLGQAPSLPFELLTLDL